MKVVLLPRRDLQAVSFSRMAPYFNTCCKTGPVGRSGEVTVVMVHFNGHEWMVELVTQPGRLFRVQSKTVPELSRTQLWDGRQARTDPGFDPQGRSTTVVRGFPTVPRNEDESSTDGATSSSSGGLKEGLAWSDLDGLTMDDLNRSDKQVSTTKDFFDLDRALLRFAHP